MDRMRIIVLLIVTFFYSQSIFALSSKDIGLYKSIFNDYRNGNFDKGDKNLILKNRIHLKRNRIRDIDYDEDLNLIIMLSENIPSIVTLEKL